MADENEQMASFLIQELKENWSYIRQIEEVRLKHTQIFFIITSAVITVFSFLIRFSDASLKEQSFEDMFRFAVNNYGIVIIACSLFVFVYGFSLCLFFASQKRGYEHYRIVNAQIRNWFTEKYGEENQFGFEKELSSKRSRRQLISSTFFYWYLLFVLVDVSAFWVFGVALMVLIAPQLPLMLSSIFSAVFSFFVIKIEICIFLKLNEKIKIGPG